MASNYGDPDFGKPPKMGTVHSPFLGTNPNDPRADPYVWNDDPLTPAEKEVLDYFEQTFMLQGVLPGEQVCVKAGFQAQVFRYAIRKKAFHHALERRGIIDRSAIKIQDGLTREQLSVANILLDFRDKRSDVKKLAECNVTTSKYNGWLKDPVFQNYIRTRSEQVINENQRDINDAVLNRARSGDIGAIKYVNQMTGYFDPDKKEVTDVNMVLMSVLDILTRKLATHPELLSEIAEDMLTLAEKAAPVGRLMGNGGTRVIEGFSSPAPIGSLNGNSSSKSGPLDLIQNDSGLDLLSLELE